MIDNKIEHLIKILIPVAATVTTQINTMHKNANASTHICAFTVYF
jgi:hypothetical protein